MILLSNYATKANWSLSYMNGSVTFAWKPVGNPNVLRSDLLNARTQLLNPERKNVRILYPHETMTNLYKTGKLGGVAEPSGLVMAPNYDHNLASSSQGWRNPMQNRYRKANDNALAKKIQSVQNSLDEMPRGW